MRVPEMVGGKITRVSNYSNANTGCYEEGRPFTLTAILRTKRWRGCGTEREKSSVFKRHVSGAPPASAHSAALVRPSGAGRSKASGECGRILPNQSPLQMYNLTGVVGAAYGRQEWKEAWRVYLGLVAMLDACVGQILDELKAQGIYEESLIVFTSDHGEMLGSHGLFQKMCMYEESARTPLYIKFPKGFPLSKQVFEKTVGQWICCRPSVTIWACIRKMPWMGVPHAAA